jgi:hypothetical protein
MALALVGVRFPFTFMGLLSIGLAAWAGIYLALHPPQDTVTLVAAGLGTLLALGLGIYVIVQRLRGLQ